MPLDWWSIRHQLGSMIQVDHQVECNPMIAQTKIHTDLKLRLGPFRAFMLSDWIYLVYTLYEHGIYHLKYTMYIHSIKKPGTDVFYHQGSGAASQATPRGHHRIRAGVGFELAIWRQPARRLEALDHKATTTPHSIYLVYHHNLSCIKMVYTWYLHGIFQ